jgi:1-acyl-sn-glycerol-3-phosphate acyltransferase
MTDFVVRTGPGGSRLAGLLLHLAGWKLVFAQPLPPKCLIVVYPHTSNWDFVIGVIARAAIGIPCKWAGKDTLFRPPLGGFFRKLGGIPVNRRIRTGFSDQIAREFHRHAVFSVVVTPEGTRSYVPHWRSGFWYAALAAKVPLALGFIDYGRREIGIGAYLGLSGDSGRDLAALAAFYAGKRGRYPQKEAPVRFREESDAGAPTAHLPSPVHSSPAPPASDSRPEP